MIREIKEPAVFAARNAEKHKKYNNIKF